MPPDDGFSHQLECIFMLGKFLWIGGRLNWITNKNSVFVFNIQKYGLSATLEESTWGAFWGVLDFGRDFQ